MVVLNDGQDEQNAALSIAGSGNRTNDIKVDGASYNDDFGLNANGYPGQNNPITLDSVDQINVDVLLHLMLNIITSRVVLLPL